MEDRQALDVVKRLYAAMGEEDIEAFIALCAEDVVIQYPAEGLLPYGGARRGRDEVRRFMELHDEAEETLAFEPGDMASKDGTVFVLGFFEGRAKPGGRVWSTRFVHALTVVEGELMRWEAFFDSAAAVEAHRGADAP